MLSPRIRLTALACAAASVGALLISATPASAEAPKEACTGLYNARIVFWAMTCSEPGEPMIGGFATWRNVPIKFDKTDTGNATVQTSNYLRVTPNTERSVAAENIEIGLYAEKTGKTTNTYGPRWTELTTSGGRTKAITAGVNPTKADKRNHTYMTVRQDRGNQWDVLYDFNKVGSTTHQLKVPRGRSNRVDVGLEVMGPKYTDVPAIASRMQFLDENRTWKRVESRNTARSVTLPACGASHKPPNCFTTKLTNATSFTQWSASKPRRQAAALAGPAAAVRSAPAAKPASRGTAPEPDVFNGVDQKALQACMEQDPDACLETVPGLADCVVSARLCNAAALPDTPQPAPQEEGEGEQVTATQIRERAASAFDVNAGDVIVTASPAQRTGLASASRGDGYGSDEVWTVSSRQSTPGLQHSDQRFDGFTARYSAATGALLDACWGQTCDQ
ncbi:hypothetical protein [Streptomyces sp. NPDC029674]|uniref:hypothetical protein n=1 Tax=Streptomyces sp. NPDC029674 TaxID=3365297 RepID=UPI00384ED7F2